MRNREVNSDGTCLQNHVSEPKVGVQSLWSCGTSGESCHVLISLLWKPNLGPLHGVTSGRCHKHVSCFYRCWILHSDSKHLETQALHKAFSLASNQHVRTHL